MWQGKSYEVVEGAGTAIYNQDVKNISHTSQSLSKHFICQPDDSNTLFYGIYGDS